MKNKHFKTKAGEHVHPLVSLHAGLTREDKFLLHDVDVSTGRPDRSAQHDLFGVVAVHAAHPIPAGVTCLVRNHSKALGPTKYADQGRVLVSLLLIPYHLCVLRKTQTVL